MTSELTKAIERQQKKFMKSAQKMDVIKERIVDAVGQFLERWYWDEAESVFRAFPEVALRLDKEKVREFQVEVGKLQESAHEIAAQELDETGIWWHLDSKNYMSNLDLNSNSPFRSALDRAAGRIKPIFRRYHIGAALHYDETLTYSIGVPWPEELKGLVREYDKIRRQTVPIKRELDKLLREKGEKEAKAIWEEVWSQSL